MKYSCDAWRLRASVGSAVFGLVVAAMRCYVQGGHRGVLVGVAPAGARGAGQLRRGADRLTEPFIAGRFGIRAGPGQQRDPDVRVEARRCGGRLTVGTALAVVDVGRHLLRRRAGDQQAGDDEPEDEAGGDVLGGPHSAHHTGGDEDGHRPNEGGGGDGPGPLAASVAVDVEAAVETAERVSDPRRNVSPETPHRPPSKKVRVCAKHGTRPRAAWPGTGAAHSLWRRPRR